MSPTGHPEGAPPFDRTETHARRLPPGPADEPLDLERGAARDPIVAGEPPRWRVELDARRELRPPGARWWRWPAAAAGVAAALVVLLQLWYLGWIVAWRWHDPAQTAFMRAELERLQHARPQAQLQHQWLPYAQIAANLKRAVIAAEDARFLEHEGVDWEAVEEAYRANQKRGGRPVRGGSTISQQLAKNLFLSGERSYLRKSEELVITYMIELAWPKRRILEVYLNVAEWGEGVFGAESAARLYFGVGAGQLAPEQAARLAAFLPSPKRYGKIRVGPFLDGRTEDILRWMPETPIP